MNSRRIEKLTGHEIVPVTRETYRPVPTEPVVGDYYGRPQTPPAMARSYLQLLRRQSRLILSTFLLLLAIGSLWLFTRQPLYRSTAEMLVTPIERASSPGGNLADTIGVTTRVRSVATEVKMLSSPDLLDAAFGNIPQEQRVLGFGTAAERLNGYPIAISNPKDTDIVRVEVTAQDPVAAATFANLILETSQARRQETIRNIAEMATQHVNKELLVCDKALRSDIAALAAYKQKRGVADLTAQTTAEATGLANLEAQAAQAQVEMTRAGETRRILENELGKTSAVVVASRTAVDSPIIQTIDAEVERLQQERARLLQEYLPTAPEVHAVDQQLAAARQRREATIDAKTESITTARNPIIDTLQQSYIGALVGEREAAKRLSIMQSYANQVRRRIASLPASEGQIALMTSRIQELQSMHAYLTSQQQALTLSMHGGLPTVMPITRARAPEQPVSPNVPISLALIVLLSGMVAVGVALLRDSLDDRLHTVDAVEAQSGHRVLASLAQVRNGIQGLVTDDVCPGALTESFRLLRGQILLSQFTPQPQVLTITSAQAGDGKSTVAANLAATTALAGKRVLLIDGDLRHPTIHRIYLLDNAQGLTSVLRDDMLLEECIYSTGIPGLSVLPAGPIPHNPSELLASERMGEILEAVREAFDVIIIDSTPVVNLSDGVLLSALADGVLVVVSSDRTHQPELQGALKTIEQTGAPILGCVYNRAMEMPHLAWMGDEED